MATKKSEHNPNAISFKAKSRERHYDAGYERAQNVIGSRIARERQKHGLSLAAFSKLLAEYGVKIGTAGISKWELRDAAPNAYQLIAICNALHINDPLDMFSVVGSSMELNNTGLEKLNAYKEDLIASGKYRRELTRETVIRYIDMPVSSLPASAGTGAFLGEEDFTMISFPESTVPAAAEFGIRISGDSMEPVYHDGQVVWVQQCSTIRIGEVGIFVYDGDGYIKVYGEQAPEDLASYTDAYGVAHMQPVMLSYNQAYAPKPISKDAVFQIVGRVL